MQCYAMHTAVVRGLGLASFCVRRFLVPKPPPAASRGGLGVVKQAEWGRADMEDQTGPTPVLSGSHPTSHQRAVIRLLISSLKKENDFP